MDKDATGQGQTAATSTWAETERVNPSKKVHSKAGIELIADEEQVGAAGGGVAGSSVGVAGREVENSTAAGGRTGPTVILAVSYSPQLSLFSFFFAFLKFLFGQEQPAAVHFLFPGTENVVSA